MGYGIVDGDRVRHLHARELEVLAALPPNVDFESYEDSGSDSSSKKIGNALWGAPAVELTSAVVRVAEAMRGRKMPTTQQLWDDYRARVAHLPVDFEGRRPCRCQH